MSKKSVFREAWSPEMMSQLFPVSCFWSCSFVPHPNWNLMLLVHQNTGKENRYQKSFLAILISTLGRFNQANKKRICHVRFKYALIFCNYLLFWTLQVSGNSNEKQVVLSVRMYNHRPTFLVQAMQALFDIIRDDREFNLNKDLMCSVSQLSQTLCYS